MLDRRINATVDYHIDYWLMFLSEPEKLQVKPICPHGQICVQNRSHPRGH